MLEILLVHQAIIRHTSEQPDDSIANEIMIERNAALVTSIFMLIANHNIISIYVNSLL